MPTLADAQQALTFFGLFCLAWVGVFKAAALLCGFFSAWWPALTRAATFCNEAATELHTLGAKIGALFPATAAKRLAKTEKSFLVPPLALLLFVCGVAGGSTACTPAQAASDVALALTGTQLLCAAAESDAPLFGATPKTTAEIAAACGVAEAQETALERAITLFQSQEAAVKTKALAEQRAFGTRK